MAEGMEGKCTCGYQKWCLQVYFFIIEIAVRKGPVRKGLFLYVEK